jgi:hypothetical protein
MANGALAVLLHAASVARGEEGRLKVLIKVLKLNLKIASRRYGLSLNNWNGIHLKINHRLASGDLKTMQNDSLQ